MEPTKEWENHTESRLQIIPQLVAWKIFSSLDVRELYWVGDFRNTYLQMIKMLPFELDQRKWYSEIVLLLLGAIFGGFHDEASLIERVISD